MHGERRCASRPSQGGQPRKGDAKSIGVVDQNRACQQLGIEPAIEQWNGHGDPQAYAISKNLHRRHLNESQRQMIAARLATLKPGDVESQIADNKDENDGDQIWSSPVTLRKAADMLNVSRSGVIEAKKILAEGTPDEIEAVEKGEAAVSPTAKNIRARTPKPPQKKQQKRQRPARDWHAPPGLEAHQRAPSRAPFVIAAAASARSPRRRSRRPMPAGRICTSPSRQEPRTSALRTGPAESTALLLSSPHLVPGLFMWSPFVHHVTIGMGLARMQLAKKRDALWRNQFLLRVVDFMSYSNRGRYRKKLCKALARADDEKFFQMVWAMDALQSGRAEAASSCISFPAEAVTKDMKSNFAVHKWDLETLIGQLLITPKSTLRDGRNRVIDCSFFDTGATAVNLLRNFENAEAGIYLKRLSIWNEAHRIGQRQFPWQRGYFNKFQFYRYAFMYGQGECANYFEHTYGLTVNDFSLIGFGLRAIFQRDASFSRPFPAKLGITPAIFEAALALFSAPIVQARHEAASMVRDAKIRHGKWLPIAYQPSFLRKFPIVSFGENNGRLRSPLPELILARITSGLYYDLAAGGQGLLNDANERFESYAWQLFARTMPRFDVKRSCKYRFQGNDIDTPDILVRDAGQVVIVAECKATKLTFAAQFADDPIAQAATAYSQIAKGVFQLWRYFSHARRGFIAEEAVSPEAHGMVLTLDTWLVMSPGLQDQVIATATEQAQRDQEITAEDRRQVVFCGIQDLEIVFDSSNEDSFLRTMAAARQNEFLGWSLLGIHDKTEGNAAQQKPFPFELGEVLPWWERMQQLQNQRV